MSNTPPVARQDPVTYELHGHARVDPYAWMRDRDDPQVLRHLEQENDYTTSVAKSWSNLPEYLFDEMRARIKEDDQSVPYRLKDFFYYSRFEAGGEYPVFARRKGSLDADEETLLDVNVLAKDLSYCDVVSMKISEDQQLLAYAVDTQGRRLFSIRIRDLRTGQDLPDTIDNVTPAMAWGNDSETLFYVRQDEETLRPNQVFRHQLGSTQTEDVMVLEEADETFHLGLYKTKSRRFIVASSHQTVTTEVSLLEADHPMGSFKTVIPRERGHEYSVAHYGEELFIRTNRDAPNFKLVRAPIANPEPSAWVDVVPHRPEVFFEGCELFKNHLVVSERERALTHFRIIPWDGRPEHSIAFEEPAYMAFLHINPEFETTILRYGYTSLTTPMSVYDYDMDTRETTLLKRMEVLGDFSPSHYTTERTWAVARDGTEVPVSLVYRKNDSPAGRHPRPLLLYGYGAYGIKSDPAFSSRVLSLLDRGFVYAIAHVRGGEELGRRWYDQGRLHHKENTFKDFIDVAEHLIEDGWTAPDRLYALGGSAGGLLMGAVINMRPELFHGVVAAVPFVDVVTTMLDPTIPLTTGEYDEWGNPEIETFYHAMLAYSPYDNVTAQDYPNLLVTSGLHDSQVQFWEPTKWVAKLRATKTDDNLLLLRTNMDAGHSGASGRFEALREVAFEYAFLLHLEAKRTS